MNTITVPVASMNRISSAVLGIIILLLLFFTVAGNHGVFHLIRQNAEVSELHAKNRALESEIISLRNNIFAVSYSDEVLEREAREDLGLSKPGEIVYIFPETKPSALEFTIVTNEESEASR
jgi:cell division protein FtsB